MGWGGWPVGLKCQPQSRVLSCGLWILDLDLGPGFGIWIWDLDLGLDLGSTISFIHLELWHLGLDNIYVISLWTFLFLPFYIKCNFSFHDNPVIPITVFLPRINLPCLRTDVDSKAGAGSWGPRPCLSEQIQGGSFQYRLLYPCVESLNKSVFFKSRQSKLRPSIDHLAIVCLLLARPALDWMSLCYQTTSTSISSYIKLRVKACACVTVSHKMWQTDT